MNNLCDISVVLSHLAFIYIGSSIFYLIVTKNMESPFMDAVKLIPELVEIKKKSSINRKRVFYTGVLISILLLLVLKPFINCFN